MRTPSPGGSALAAGPPSRPGQDSASGPSPEAPGPGRGTLRIPRRTPRPYRGTSRIRGTTARPRSSHRSGGPRPSGIRTRRMPWLRSSRRATPSALSTSITARRLFLNLAMSLIWAAMYSSRFRQILAWPFDLPLTKASHSRANPSGESDLKTFLRPFLARRCSLVNSNALMVSQ